MTVDEPPFLLDGARVVEYAALPPLAERRERLGVVVEGISTDTDTVACLAVVERLVDGAVFLLHCNARWETVAAGRHRDPASARAAGDLAYGSLNPRWQRYRALTSEEEREIATTRAFLRDIAAEG